MSLIPGSDGRKRSISEDTGPRPDADPGGDSSAGNTRWRRSRTLLRSRIFQTISALYGVRVVNQLLPLITLPYLSRVLGPTEWGTVAFAQAFAIWASIVVEYGFHFAGTREVARERADRGRLAELLAGILSAQALLAGGVILLTIVLLATIPAVQAQPAMILLALLYACFQGFNPGWYFTGHERIGRLAIADTTSKALGTAAIFLLVQGQGDGVWVLAALAAAAIASSFIGFAMLLVEIRPARPSLAETRGALKLGFPMFVLKGAVITHTIGNAFLLGLLAPASYVAFFYAAEKLTRPLANFFVPASTGLMPRLASLARREAGEGQTLAALGLWLLGGTSLAIGATMFLIAPFAIPFVFGPGYEPSILILQIMAVIIPLTVINTALTIQWLMPLGLDKPLCIATVAGTVVNLGLALTLVPTFRSIGMAWITVVVELVVLAGLTWILMRRGIRPWHVDRSLLGDVKRTLLASRPS